jgi:hypothetical protein
LNNTEQLLKQVAKIESANCFFNLELLEEAMQVRTVYRAKGLFIKLKESFASEKVKQNELFA